MESTHKIWKQGALENDDVTLETHESDHTNEDILEHSTKATKDDEDGKRTIDHLSLTISTTIRSKLS